MSDATAAKIEEAMGEMMRRVTPGLTTRQGTDILSHARPETDATIGLAWEVEDDLMRPQGARSEPPTMAKRAGYAVVLEPDPDGGYVATVPAFPGCYSQGESIDEAVSNAREAILLTIEDMRERGESIPDPSAEILRNVAVAE